MGSPRSPLAGRISRKPVAGHELSEINSDSLSQSSTQTLVSFPLSSADYRLLDPDQPPLSTSESNRSSDAVYQSHPTGHDAPTGDFDIVEESIKMDEYDDNKEDSVAHRSLIWNRRSKRTFSKPPMSRSRWQMFRRSLSYSWIDWWLFEILSWVLSALALGTILLILALHDGQGLPDWPLGITINGVVSTFATISKAALMVPVVECIGQLKWTWFAHPERSLADFQTIDSASRGSWGSMRLLGLQKGRHLASLGAVITIVALAISPVTQQTIAYPQNSISVDGVAEIPRAEEYLFPMFSDQPSEDNQVPAYLPDGLLGFIPLVHTSTRGAFYSGLYTSVDVNVSYVTAGCSTGNCTFPLYRTLGVCAIAENVTDLLTTNCSAISCARALPNDITVQNDTLLQLWSVSVYDDDMHTKTTSLRLPDIQWPLADVFVVYNYTAFEFALYFCIQELNTTAVDGQSSTVLTNSWANLTFTVEEMSHENNKPSYHLNAPNDTTTYNISTSAMLALSAFSRTVLNGSFKPDDTNNRYSSEAARVLGSLINNGEDMSTSFANILQNIATSLSNNLREFSNFNNSVTGQSTKYQTFIQVRWEWLSLLIAAVVLSLVFLIVTIAHNSHHKHRVWKTSSLATLQGLNGEARANLGALTSISALEEKATKIAVRLEELDDGDWKLVNR